MTTPKCRYCGKRVPYFGDICNNCLQDFEQSERDNDGLMEIVRDDIGRMIDKMDE